MKVIHIQIEIPDEQGNVTVEDVDENILNLRDALHQRIVGWMDDICESTVRSWEEER